MRGGQTITQTLLGNNPQITKIPQTKTKITILPKPRLYSFWSIRVICAACGQYPMNKFLRISGFSVLLFFTCGFAECYKPVTKNQLPDRIHTVAVPAFQMESSALRYKIGSRFTDAVMKDLVREGSGISVYSK